MGLEFRSASGGPADALTVSTVASIIFDTRCCHCLAWPLEAGECSCGAALRAYHTLPCAAAITAAVSFVLLSSFRHSSHICCLTLSRHLCVTLTAGELSSLPAAYVRRAMPEALVNPLADNAAIKSIPLEHFPRDLFMIGRSLMILRGLTHALDMNIKVAVCCQKSRKAASLLGSLCMHPWILVCSSRHSRSSLRELMHAILHQTDRCLPCVHTCKELRILNT